MFFRKKARERNKESERFKTIVVKLMDGIHALDKHIQEIDHDRQYGYNQIAFIDRSLEDLIALCNIYREQKLFHIAFSFQMEECLKDIGKESAMIINLSQVLDVSVMIYNQGSSINNTEFAEALHHDMIDEIPDEMRNVMNEIDSGIDELKMHIDTLFVSIHNKLLRIRSMILTIRYIVSIDYMGILVGIDLHEHHELNERLIRGEIKRMIRFDKRQQNNPINHTKEE